MALPIFQLKPLPLIDPDPQILRWQHWWSTATPAEKQAVLDADKRRKEEQENESKSE